MISQPYDPKSFMMKVQALQNRLLCSSISQLARRVHVRTVSMVNNGVAKSVIMTVLNLITYSKILIKLTAQILFYPPCNYQLYDFIML